MTAVVTLLDSYGEAVEADLFDRGQDLLAWFRGERPWPQLLRLVNRLPPLSHYRRAVADDDDLAARLLDQAQGPAKARPRLAHWTEWDELYATLAEGFHLVQLAIASANTPKGRSAPKFQPQPRPKTAQQRAASRREWLAHEELVRKVLPHQN